MSKLNIPAKTIENIKKTATMEYYRLTYNQEGEKIRSGKSVVNALVELFVDELLKVDEFYKHK